METVSDHVVQLVEDDDDVGAGDEDAELATSLHNQDSEEGFQEDEDHHPTVQLRTSLSPSSASRGKYYKQTYRSAWEQMPDFRGWLHGVVGAPTRAYCSYCRKTLHAHRLSLLKHTCTIRHQKAAQMHNSRKRKHPDQTKEYHTVLFQPQDDEDPDKETTRIELAEAAFSGTEDPDEKPNDSIDDDEDEDDANGQVVGQMQLQRNYVNKAEAPISTHVIDTTRGVPVSGLQVSLYKLIDGRWTYINEGMTNAQGKFSNFIDRPDFTMGRYKLHFDVDRYFEARKQETMYPFIEVVFDARSLTDKYHVPILMSPYGYSTYKGA